MPAKAERTATMMPTWTAPNPMSAAMNVVSSGMALEKKCSKAWAPISVDAITPFPVRRP